MAKCGECGREFSTDEALRQHISDKHGGQAPQPGAADTQSTKREKKSLRKKDRHPVAIGVGVAAIVLVAALYYAVAPTFAPTPLPCTGEGVYIHVHPYLIITINGQNVTIPNGLGDLRGGTCIEPLHTHDASGLLHIEIPQNFANLNITLGDFFKVWAVSSTQPTLNGATLPAVFTATDLLGFKADATHKVVVLAGGQTYTSDPTQLLLTHYAYCNSSNGNVPPCSVTAGPSEDWNGGSNYPYPTGHPIIVEYVSNSTA